MAGGDLNVTAALLQKCLDVGLGHEKAIVAPKWSGPQYDVYSCILAHGVRPQQVDALSRALGLAAQAATCRVSTVDGMLLLEIPKREGERLPLLAGKLDQVTSPKPLAVPIGVTTGGKLLWVDLEDERQAHLLLGGTSGSGKTMLLKWLLYRWLTQNGTADLAVVGADPKLNDPQEGLFHFRQAAHLIHPLQRTTSEVVRLLTWVLCEMERRDAMGYRTPRLLVVIDEVAHFTSQSTKVPVLLGEIVQKCRSQGINVIATAQNPSVENIGKGIVNFQVTIMGRIPRRTQAYGATGRVETAADELLMRGDLLYLGAGETIRFQAPLVGLTELRELPRARVRSLADELPSSAMIDTGIPKQWGGKVARPFTAEEIARATRLVQARRGVDAVRRELSIGTDRAKVLYQQIKEGVHAGGGAGQATPKFALADGHRGGDRSAVHPVDRDAGAYSR